MKMFSTRNSRKRQAQALFECDPDFDVDQSEVQGVVDNLFVKSLAITNKKANVLVFLASIVLFCLVFFLGSAVLPKIACVAAAMLSMFLPFWIQKSNREKKAALFCEDFPTVLLATSSSIKAGMTAIEALERSVRLLPEESIVRVEVSNLLTALSSGEDKQKSLERFAKDIEVPEVTLFRTAYMLVLEHGGKFGPTLERLAMVCNDRMALINGARVSTTTMRMTANVLLFITPLIMLMIGARTPDFWVILKTHPVASTVSSIGFILIIGSYFILLKMSAFKP